ncbi:MAG: hypothetical protein PHY23_04745 [Oscillospiraceae bacterium]|nr:hypothetical protein [Oscillospiraceae bacterium]
MEQRLQKGRLNIPQIQHDDRHGDLEETVSFSFIIISPMPHLRLAKLKRRSTSTRLHSSRYFSTIVFRFKASL